jgi:hypothetical protein
VREYLRFVNDADLSQSQKGCAKTSPRYGVTPTSRGQVEIAG